MVDLLDEIKSKEQAEEISIWKKLIEDTIREYLIPVAEKVDRTNELLITRITQINSLERRVGEIEGRNKKKRSEIQPKSMSKFDSKDKQKQKIFYELTKKWKEETINLSSMQRITSNSSYLSIIGLGPDAIPLILEELVSEPDWWFCALRSITRVDPVTENMRGDLIAMKNSWLDWGRKNGYI